MVLNSNDIDNLVELILDGEQEAAIKFLVDKTSCDEVDARNLVDEYIYNQDIEYLLDKHWIEQGTGSNVPLEKTMKFSSKDKRNMFKIFAPFFIILALTIYILIKY